MLKIIDCKEEYIDEISIIEQNEFDYATYSKDDLNNFIINELNIDYFKILINDNNELYGYIIYRINDISEIFKIYIKEKFRGNKYGELLLLDCIENTKIKNIKQIYLEVESNNLSAIRFYQNNRFEISNIRKNYYKTKDALILIRNME